MSNAGTDQNTKPTLIAVSNVNGTDIVPLYADPVTHRLLVNMGGGASLVVGTTAITGGATKRVLYDNAGVLGEYILSASQAVATDASLNLVSFPYSTVATGSTLAVRDANGNLVAVNTISATASIVSSGGTTVLTAGSAQNQQITGTLTQIIQLPDATTLIKGWSFQINNDSTGAVTIKNNGGTTLTTISSGGFGTVLVTDNSTSNGVWDIYFSVPSTLTASQILSTDAVGNIQSLPVSTYPSLTELSYVKGVTSGIQAQINTKGTGTVTAIGVTTANGVSGSSSGGATPNLTITLGAITPTTVNGNTLTTGTYTLTGTAGKTLNFTNSLTLTGTDGEIINVTGAGNRKILVGNGTNMVLSTETYAVPGTSGNVLTSDGTNWTSVAPSGGSTSISVGGIAIAGNSTNINGSVNSNTTLILGQIVIPANITANQLSFIGGGYAAGPGPLQIALFSSDGQTRLFSVSATIPVAGGQLVSSSLSAVTITTGIYYIGILGLGAIACSVQFGTSIYNPILKNPSGKAVTEGTLTVTADTMPTTITPSSITGSINRTLVIRFDN